MSSISINNHPLIFSASFLQKCSQEMKALMSAPNSILPRDTGSCHSILPETGSGHSVAKSDVSRPSYDSPSIDSTGIELLNNLSKQPMRLRARCEVRTSLGFLKVSVVILNLRNYRDGRFQEKN